MMVVRSHRSRELLVQLRRIASCDASVLLEGETGTGKELAAREIHYASARAEKPFVPVNCGALPDSLIESELFGHCRGAFTDAKDARAGLIDHAEGGTIFFDEVDTLSPKAQVTMLRFLQDREFRPVGASRARAADVRVIAATNASLDKLAAEGGFRRDLLYRLNALHVRLSPLREREADIAPLAVHFLEAASRQLSIEPRRWTESALRALIAYPWPGNVRELENIALRACLCADSAEVGVAELITADEAFAAIAVLEPRADVIGSGFVAAKSSAIASFEHSYLTDLMRRAGGNVSEAARLSRIERRQLGKLLKKRGIGKETFRQSS